MKNMKGSNMFDTEMEILKNMQAQDYTLSDTPW